MISVMVNMVRRAYPIRGTGGALTPPLVCGNVSKSIVGADIIRPNAGIYRNRADNIRPYKGCILSPTEFIAKRNERVG